MARGAAVATADPHVGYGVAFGDTDRDGWLDLFVAEWRPDFLPADPNTSHTRLLRNRGVAQPGHFDDVTAAAGVDIAAASGLSWAFAPAFADLDGDGWTDLTLAADFGTSRLFWNQGDGTFQDGTVAAGVGTDENGMGSTFGDYDGDGDLDWFVTSIFDPLPTCQGGACGWGGSGNRLYRNEGSRVFSDQTGSAATGVRNGDWGWGTVFFDFDNDGDLDLAMTNGVDFPESQLVPPTLDDPWLADPMRLWRNDGGAWTEVSTAAGITDTGSGKGLLTFDYDSDGDLDLFVVNTGSGGRLLRNDGGNAQDWLRVKAWGRVTNRDSYGARVEVTLQPGGATQVREIGVASHFLGQSERTAHFGLGSGTGPVHQVRVHWPKNNRTRIWTDVARNTTLLAEEPRRMCGLLGPEALLALAIHGAWRRKRSRTD